MKTLRFFATRPKTLPQATAWYLADLGEARGKQAFFTHQSPQRLERLRQHAMVESAVSSNRIEGVEVEQTRVAQLVLGETALRDRNEEEVRGYRDALELIHAQRGELPVSEETIRRLHALSRWHSADGGQYKERASDIIERYPDGRERVRFKTVPPEETAEALCETLELWQLGLDQAWIHPLILLGAFNLDFLSIHPFRDGNGRVSRLLLLLQSYHLGFEAGRYVSLERLIEENKDRYYETLELSSTGWHDGRHDPWPYVNYLLFILKLAYRELESRLGEREDGASADSR
jgi:Fic family protein